MTCLRRGLQNKYSLIRSVHFLPTIYRLIYSFCRFFGAISPGHTVFVLSSLCRADFVWDFLVEKLILMKRAMRNCSKDEDGCREYRRTAAAVIVAAMSVMILAPITKKTILQ